MKRDLFSEVVFENGLTIREFKEIVKDWPEKNEKGKDMKVFVSATLGPIRDIISVSVFRPSLDTAIGHLMLNLKPGEGKG